VVDAPEGIENVVGIEVAVVANALETRPDKDVEREVGKVKLTVALVATVHVLVDCWGGPGINMEERSGRSMV
jgi:hypothetical protein